MPISFDAQPWPIRKNIVEKIEYTDFARFHQSSKAALSRAERVKTRFTIPEKYCKYSFFEVSNEKVICSIGSGVNDLRKSFDLADAPLIRFEAASARIMNPLNEDLCQNLIDFFSRSGSTVGEFIFFETDQTEMKLSAKSFSGLLRSAKAKEVQFASGSISREVFRNIPETISKIKCSAPIEDEDLMSSTIEDIYVRHHSLISTEGIIRFLKEWREGKRRFKALELWTFEIVPIFEILEDFEYSDGFSIRQVDSEYQEFVVENGPERLKISLNVDYEAGESSLFIRIEENCEKPESVDEHDEYEEDVDEEDEDNE